MSSLKKALLALVAVALSVGYLWLADREIVPRTATWQEIEAEARQGGYELIATDELSRKYETKPDSFLLVDTRQEWEYRTGHIKGAVNFPMEPTWLSRWRNKGALEKFLGADKNRFTVFY